MPENIESLDIQIWVNKLAKQSVKSVASGVKKLKKRTFQGFWSCRP